jgi:hypothetical protein
MNNYASKTAQRQGFRLIAGTLALFSIIKFNEKGKSEIIALKKRLQCNNSENIQ